MQIRGVLQEKQQRGLLSLKPSALSLAKHQYSSQLNRFTPLFCTDTDALRVRVPSDLCTVLSSLVSAC